MTAVQEIPVREAAERTGRSAETIRRWIWSGRLPAVKRGNTYYVDVMRLQGVAAEMGITMHGGPDAPSGGLAAWLAEVDQWKSGLAAAAGRPGRPARPTASDLVLEDRRARR